MCSSDLDTLVGGRHERHGVGILAVARASAGLLIVFFDAESAAKLKKVLESGASEDPMILFETMRGHRPTPDALLRQRGLAK